MPAGNARRTGGVYTISEGVPSKVGSEELKAYRGRRGHRHGALVRMTARRIGEHNARGARGEFLSTATEFPHGAGGAAASGARGFLRLCVAVAHRRGGNGLGHRVRYIRLRTHPGELEESDEQKDPKENDRVGAAVDEHFCEVRADEYRTCGR